MAVQAVEPMGRPNEGTHRPHGLGSEARMIYDRAYSRAATAYSRKHGGPAVKLDKLGTDHTPAERAKLAPILADRTTEHVIERHPACHRAGMAALNKYHRARGLEPVADPAKPAAAKRTSTRKPAARKLAAVPDPAPAKPAKPAAEPVSAPVVALEPVPAAPADEVAPYRTRKAARRELAAMMRAEGLDPSDPVAWEAAKRSAGIR